MFIRVRIFNLRILYGKYKLEVTYKLTINSLTAVIRALLELIYLDKVAPLAILIYLLR